MGAVTIQTSDTRTQARIQPDFGFNCFEFRCQINDRSLHILDAPDDFAEHGGRPSGFGIPILFPYPNRIAAGRFDWEGTSYVLSPDQVAFDNLGNAIHGFCHDRPWRVIDQAGDRVTAEFQLSLDAPDRLKSWPGDLRIRCTYWVTEGELHTDFEIHNPDSVDVPWGLGTHPYFRVPFVEQAVGDEVLIEAPAAQLWELADLVPTGKRTAIPAEVDLRSGQSLAQLKLDHVLTDVGSPGRPWSCQLYCAEDGLQLTQVASGGFQHLVVFTPPNRAAVCLEPYTCVTNAINMVGTTEPHGLQVLAPGHSIGLRVLIQAGLVVA